ncbi:MULTISPECIES: hypothetical protein [Photorhabdus]|uniref:Uncharacterized protein n=1 Tax=Photorhabdus bodei TaxID=2029681 RepID=A0AAW6BQV1_9GAMM|nr:MULTISPECIES: hypothetical protein [Photorhabdus]MDB6374235.1 hypothetical protein [Photorhabdus bodei]
MIRQQVLALRGYVLHQVGLKGVTWNSKIAHLLECELMLYIDAEPVFST